MANSYIKAASSSYFLVHYYNNLDMDELLKISREIEELFGGVVIISTHYKCIIVYHDNVEQLRRVKEWLKSV